MEGFLDFLGGVSRDDLELKVLGRLVTAALLGAAVGLERELKGKEAGLRTNILICIGAALFTYLSTIFIDFHDGPVDPGRVASNIVTGVGFLGAGVIWHSPEKVSGLTTAATIWVVAAIGMAAGTGSYVVAVGTTFLVLLILYPLGALETRKLERERKAARADAKLMTADREGAEEG